MLWNRHDFQAALQWDQWPYPRAAGPDRHQFLKDGLEVLKAVAPVADADVQEGQQQLDRRQPKQPSCWLAVEQQGVSIAL